MSGLKTKPSNQSVKAYIDSVDNASKKEDSYVLLKALEEASGFKAKVWGDNFIIGLGHYTYKRKGGKEEFEWFHLGFAPRKTKLTLYLTFNLSDMDDLLDNLGKYKRGSGCFYINKLKDIDLDILRKIIDRARNNNWYRQL